MCSSGAPSPRGRAPTPACSSGPAEPTTLSGGGEADLGRRRPRWIQIGGPITDGPHARLAFGPSETGLQRTLEQLLSRG